MTTFSLYCQYIGEIKRSMSRDEKLTSYSFGEGVKGTKNYQCYPTSIISRK